MCERCLQPGEEIRFQTNGHWFVYLPAVVMFLVGIAFVLRYTVAEVASHPLILSVLSAVAGVLLFIACVAEAMFGTEIVVTERRVIYKTGWCRGTRQKLTWRRSRAWIQPIDLGRVFAFGTLHHSRRRGDNRGAAEHCLAPSVSKPIMVR